MALSSIFKIPKPIIGVIHLPPLPGSPLYEGDFQKVLKRALEDAKTYLSGGVNGLIVENYGDRPFFKTKVGPETVASMTVIAQKVKELTGLPLGINVLRNDGISALAIATAVGAQFIRVNVLEGAYITDQGIIEGISAELMRFRASLKSSVKIFADVFVKHATPMGGDFELHLKDAVERGLADAVIITGERTGEEVSEETLGVAKQILRDIPIIVGSGVTPDNIENYREADAFIVGSYFKLEANPLNPPDINRVRELVDAVRKMRDALEEEGLP